MRTLRRSAAAAFAAVAVLSVGACRNPAGPPAAGSTDPPETVTRVLGDPLRDVYVNRDRGRYDAAISAARRILDGNPAPELQARAYDALASVHWTRARSRKADAAAQEDRGAALAAAERAVAAARQLIGSDTEPLVTYGLRYGQYLEAESRWSDAASQYEALLATSGLTDARRFELLLRLGAAHYQRGGTLPASEAAAALATADAHWQAASALPGAASVPAPLRGELHFWRGLAAREQRRPQAAATELTSALDLLPADSEFRSATERNLILSLIDAGRYPEAADRARSLEKASDPFGLATRGYVQAALGDFAAARDAFVLAEHAARLDPQYTNDTAFQAELVMQRADCAVGLGELTDAQRALADAWKDVGPRLPAPTRAQLAAQLGRVHLAAYQLDDAQEWLTRAIELQRATLGESHAETLRTKLDLAAEARERGRLGEARQMAQRALDGLAAALGPDHPWVAEARQLVSGIALELGECPAAVEQADAARQAFDAHYGPQHPDAVLACLRAAVTATKCRGSGGDARADALQTDARNRVTQLATALGPRDTRVLVARLYLADMAAETPGHEAEALQAYTELEAAYAQNRALDPCHPDVLKLQLGRSRLLVSLDRAAEAETLLRSVLARCATRNRDEPQIAWLWESLGNAQTALDKPAEAREALQEAYRILLRIYGREHPEVQRFVQRLSAT